MCLSSVQCVQINTSSIWWTNMNHHSYHKYMYVLIEGGILGGGQAFTELGTTRKSALVEPRIRVNGNAAALQVLYVYWRHYWFQQRQQPCNSHLWLYSESLRKIKPFSGKFKIMVKLKGISWGENGNQSGLNFGGLNWYYHPHFGEGTGYGFYQGNLKWREEYLEMLDRWLDTGQSEKPSFY